MTRLTVRITPNASRSEVVKKEGGVWHIKLAAPPVDGRANDELIRVIADEFDCAPSLVSIVKGQTSRTKLIEIP